MYKKMKKGILCSALSLILCMMCLAFCGMLGDTAVAVASEKGDVREDVVSGDEIVTIGAVEVSDEQSGEEAVSTEETAAATTQPEEPPFNAKEKFVIFVCCLFSVSLCIVLALFGNPNDRLKDKYKRARKQQMLQEKRQKEKEEREAKRAAAEAKYAEELAQYEADMKAYEEEKAAKAAAKAAKKAAKK